MKLIVSDVIPCVLKFLSDCGFTETFQTLRKECDINTRGGLSQANLLKICKFYLKNHPEAWIEENEEELFENKISMENEQEFVSIKSKRSAPRDISEEEVNDSENEEESEQEIIQIKPIKKMKTENGKTNNDASKIPKKKNNKKQANENNLQQVNNENNNEGFSPVIAENYYEKENQKRNKERFSYVDAGIISEIREDLRDNTFEAKYKYGEGDEFGRFGNERLKEVKGRDFKKEKAKLKNKQFHGGGGRIDAYARSSVKLNFEE